MSFNYNLVFSFGKISFIISTEIQMNATKEMIHC